MTVLDDERLVLGALCRRSLRPGEVDVIEWSVEHHAQIADVLVAALELHGRVDLELVLAVCRKAKIAPVGAVFAHGRRRVLVGYLPTIARAAPSRKAALEAVRRLEVAAEDRFRAKLEQEKLRDSFEVQQIRGALRAALAGDAASARARLARAQSALGSK